MTKLGDFVAKSRAELGLTQEQLAQAAGLSDAAIGKIERGETRRPNNIDALAAALLVNYSALDDLAPVRRRGVFDFSGMAKLSRNTMHDEPDLPQPRAYSEADIPVLGSAYGSASGDIIGVQQEIERVKRPANLEGVRDAYAVYVRGESMVPRYYPGELVCVNPNKPVTRGSFCVVQVRDHNDGPPREAFIKQYIGEIPCHPEEPPSWTKVQFKQFNPEKDDIIWKWEDIYAIHLIVGTQS